jgi:hypothetical protein
MYLFREDFDVCFYSPAQDDHVDYLVPAVVFTNGNTMRRAAATGELVRDGVPWGSLMFCERERSLWLWSRSLSGKATGVLLPVAMRTVV